VSAAAKAVVAATVACVKADGVKDKVIDEVVHTQSFPHRIAVCSLCRQHVPSRQQ